MFLSRLAPRFDVALRDVRSERQEFRLEAAQALARAASESERADAREALRPLLDDEVARVRAAAMTSLGFVGDETDVTRLLRATRDPRPMIRETAVIAIGHVATPAATSALLALLDSAEAEVRYHALVALGSGLDAAATAQVARGLGDTDAFVREAAATSLGGLGDGAIPHREALASRLDDVAPVRNAAAHALAAIGDARAVPALLEDVRRGRPSSDTLHAIVALDVQSAREPLYAIARRFIAPRALRLEAAAALAALGDDRGAAHLRERLEGLFLRPKLESLAFIASFRVFACAADVAALVERPGRVPLDVVAHTLERLDASAPGQRGLANLARLDHDPRTSSSP